MHDHVGNAPSQSNRYWPGQTNPNRLPDPRVAGGRSSFISHSPFLDHLSKPFSLIMADRSKPSTTSDADTRRHNSSTTTLYTAQQDLLRHVSRQLHDQRLTFTAGSGSFNVEAWTNGDCLSASPSLSPLPASRRDEILRGLLFDALDQALRLDDCLDTSDSTDDEAMATECHGSLPSRQ